MKKSKPEVVRTHLETIVDLMSTAVFLLLFMVGFYALFDIHFIQVSARMDEEIASLAPDDAGIDIAALQDHQCRSGRLDILALADLYWSQ